MCPRDAPTCHSGGPCLVVGHVTEIDLHPELRPLLFSIAYRMIGSVSEAEDIVQEAFLRYHRAQPEDVENPKAYLSAVTTRLAIDHLRSARARREEYVGPWLPEPLLVDEQAPDPEEQAEFLLREVFGYPYDEIAGVIDRSEDNARQLVTRARRHVDAERPRFEVDRQAHEELTERFMEAVYAGDTEGLIELLAADVVAYTDGGGKVQAARKPLHGADRVARFLLGAARRGAAGLAVEAVVVNGW